MKQRKEYNVLQNSIYILRGINTWQKTLFPILIIHILLSAFEILVLPYLLKFIIEDVNKQVDIMVLFRKILICTGSLVIIRLSISFLENQEWWRLQYCRMNFMKSVLNTSLTMDYERLENPTVLDSYQKAMNAVTISDRGLEGMTNNMISFSIAIAKAVAASAVIYTLNPVLIFVMLIIVLIQFVPTDKTKKRDKKEVWDKLAPYWRKFYDLNYLTQNFEYAKDIRLYNMSEWIHKKHLDINGQIQEIIMRSKKLWTKCQVILRFLYFFQEVILYLWLLYYVLYGDLSIGDFTLYLTAVRTFSACVGDVLWKYANIRNQSAEVNDYREFLEYNIVNECNESYLSLQEVVFAKKEMKKCQFTFENVSFCYEGQEKYAIRNLNMTIEAGKRLAIVGLNGSGKTTLIKLLCRLYEPQEGRILLNGIDIRKFNKIEYFNLFSPVFQNVQMYAFSMAENVSMRTSEETDYKCAENCISKVGLGAKVDSLPNGVHTQLFKIIFDDGIDLSGGEKQKLALARAIYKDAPVILLDEPTAALDPIAEYNQYKDFDKLVGDKTVLYISHRLASTRFCDNIATFNNGEMVEFGTHDQLIKMDGYYSAMFNLQAQYYMEEKGGDL